MHTLLCSVPLTLQQATTNPHCCWRLLDTHRQVWVSLLWDHCSFVLGPGAHKVLFVSSKGLFPQSCVSFGSSIVGLSTTSSKRSYATHRPALPRAPAPESGHCWPGPPQDTLKHSKAGLTQSLWGLLVHTRFCLSPPSLSVGMGFDSRHDFSPPTILLGLLLCPWTWDIWFWWGPTFSCRWLLSGKLKFWSSHRWAHVLLLRHLVSSGPSMSLHVSTKGFPSFSQLSNILLCIFTHPFYPFNFWWILWLLPSLDYCCNLTFENVLTIKCLISHHPLTPLLKVRYLVFQNLDLKDQSIFIEDMWFILFFKIWLHCTACRILVPQPETKPGHWAVNTQIPICWPTRKFPVIYFLKFTNHYVSPKKDVGMRKVMKGWLKWREGRNNTKTLTI